MMHEELEHPDSEWPLGSVIKAEDAAEHLASIAVQLHDALGQMAEEMVYEKDR